MVPDCRLFSRLPGDNEMKAIFLFLSVHGGAGKLDFMALLDFHALDTNLQFLHRGVIEPKSGIGHHFYNNCAGMFVILDGEAQFTVDDLNDKREDVSLDKTRCSWP
jgi:hypothetical protein